MTIWVDAQLSPRTARWISTNFPVAAFPLLDGGEDLVEIGSP